MKIFVAVLVMAFASVVAAPAANAYIWPPDGCYLIKSHPQPLWYCVPD